MKTTKVVAAIIVHDGKVFATQRGYGEFKDGWEFPGGKTEHGESSEDAIVREIKEELDADIEVVKYLDTVEYDYPTFHLSMDCFICRMKSDEMIIKEAEDVRWLTIDDLYSVEWLPADLTLIPKIEEYLNKQ